MLFTLFRLRFSLLEAWSSRLCFQQASVWENVLNQSIFILSKRLKVNFGVEKKNLEDRLVVGVFPKKAEIYEIIILLKICENLGKVN